MSGDAVVHMCPEENGKSFHYINKLMCAGTTYCLHNLVSYFLDDTLHILDSIVIARASHRPNVQLNPETCF